MTCACNLYNLWAFAELLEGADAVYFDGLAKHLDLHDLTPSKKRAATRRLRELVGA